SADGVGVGCRCFEPAVDQRVLTRGVAPPPARAAPVPHRMEQQHVPATGRVPEGGFAQGVLWYTMARLHTASPLVPRPAPGRLLSCHVIVVVTLGTRAVEQPLQRRARYQDAPADPNSRNLSSANRLVRLIAAHAENLGRFDNRQGCTFHFHHDPSPLSPRNQACAPRPHLRVAGTALLGGSTARRAQAKCPGPAA